MLSDLLSVAWMEMRGINDHALLKSTVLVINSHYLLLIKCFYCQVMERGMWYVHEVPYIQASKPK